MSSRKERVRGNTKLPEWAASLWKDLGSPDLSKVENVYHGPLIDRRHGLRRDDLVEIELDARAYPEGSDLMIRGRLLSTGKSSIEIVDELGKFQYVARDVIVKLTLVAHTRPAYLDDEELLNFEKEDIERRGKVHEKVEKKIKGRDDHHLWG